jgi:thioredoxin-like negative regulator of GroEL
VGKVNVHENFDLANEYNINRIPQVLIFKGGKKPVQQMAGLTSEKELVRVLAGLLR